MAKGRAFRFRVALYLALGAGALVHLLCLHEPDLGFDGDVTAFWGMAGEGELEDARALLDRMHERFPTDPRVPLLQAWLEQRTGDRAAALAAYEAALPLCDGDEQTLEVLVAMADIRRLQGRSDRARRDLEEATSAYGESARTHHLRAVLLMQKRSWNAALGEIDRLAEEDSMSPYPRRLRQRVQRLQGIGRSPGLDAAATGITPSGR